jgi:HK97 family phage prohead protease
MKKNIEYRTVDPVFTSFRAVEEDGKKFLEGYGSVFNQRSKLIYEHGKFFFEIIDPKAFDEVLRDESLDVYLTLNHSRDKVIARTISGTLTLTTDEKGLLFRAEMPNVSYANDTYELVSRGDLFENSFAFVVNRNDEEWTKDKDGNNIRFIKKVSKLIDVSVVTNGAYANTTVSARQIQLDNRGQTITITINDTEDEPEDEPQETVALPEDPSTNEDALTADSSTNEEEDKEKSRKSKELMEMHLRILKLKL